MSLENDIAVLNEEIDNFGSDKVNNNKMASILKKYIGHSEIIDVMAKLPDSNGLRLLNIVSSVPKVDVATLKKINDRCEQLLQINNEKQQLLDESINTKNIGAKKVDNIYNKYKVKQLSLDEVGILFAIRDNDALFVCADILSKTGDPTLQQLTVEYERSSKFANVLSDKINESYSKQAQIGDLFEFKGERNMLLKQNAGSLGGSFGSVNLHSTTVYAKEGSSIKASGIRGNGHELDDIRGTLNMLACDLYHIDVLKLVPEKILERLTNQEKMQIVDKFSSLTQLIHEDKTGHLQNLNVTGGQVVKSLWKRYCTGFRSDPRDFTKIAAKMWGNSKNIEGEKKEYGDKDNPYVVASKKSEMICSEFAAKTIIAVLCELGNWMKGEFKEKVGNDEKCINIPFSDKQKLSGILPWVLKDTLKQAGCLTKVDFDDLSAIINLDNTKKVSRNL